jgi:hypothetical protein
MFRRLPRAFFSAFDAELAPRIVVSPHARLPRVSEARGALPAEASPTVLAPGRPMHRRTRPIVHSTANAAAIIGDEARKGD